MTFEGLPPGSATPDMPADAIYVVTEVYPSHVVLDGNHPLAGMALRLTIKVQDVRDASREEIEARSVGGAPITVLGSGTSPAGRRRCTDALPSRSGAAGGAEAARAAGRRLEVVDAPERRLHHRHDDHLRDALQRLHREGGARRGSSS